MGFLYKLRVDCDRHSTNRCQKVDWKLPGSQEKAWNPQATSKPPKGQTTKTPNHKTRQTIDSQESESEPELEPESETTQLGCQSRL